MPFTRSRYDGYAEWYDGWNQPAAERNAPDVLDLLGPGEGLCLDLGCGSGHYFDALASTGRTVIGLDRSGVGGGRMGTGPPAGSWSSTPSSPRDWPSNTQPSLAGAQSPQSWQSAPVSAERTGDGRTAAPAAASSASRAGERSVKRLGRGTRTDQAAWSGALGGQLVVWVV